MWALGTGESRSVSKGIAKKPSGKGGFGLKAKKQVKDPHLNMDSFKYETASLLPGCIGASGDPLLRSLGIAAQTACISYRVVRGYANSRSSRISSARRQSMR